jgi:hypothetical protein
VLAANRVPPAEAPRLRGALMAALDGQPVAAEARAA